MKGVQPSEVNVRFVSLADLILLGIMRITNKHFLPLYRSIPLLAAQSRFKQLSTAFKTKKAPLKKAGQDIA